MFWTDTMRFAITLSDRFKGVLDACLQAGWTPVKMFCTQVDSRMHHNKASLALAEKHKIPVQMSRMSECDLRDLADQQCEALLVASYNWRIPDWTPYLQSAVNFHPSPLPDGKGAYPQVRAILDGYEQWACSCHKLTPELDSGDILSQEFFPLMPDETHQTLDIKLQLAVYRLANRVIPNYRQLWEQAQPQAGEGSYWRLWSDEDRMLDFAKPVAALQRQLRAFGDFECWTKVNGVLLFVHRAQGWQETHNFAPGTLVYTSAQSLLVAAADGMLLISEWSLYGPDAITGRYRG